MWLSFFRPNVLPRAGFVDHFFLPSAAGFAAYLCSAGLAFAHGAWLDTGDFKFSTASIATLQSNVDAGIGGYQDGDFVEYQVTFPVFVAGTVSGANGYFTFYVPTGTQVANVWIVDNAGNPISARPAEAANGDGTSKGWGPLGQKTFAVGGNGWNPSSNTVCTASGYPGTPTTTNCDTGLAYVYGDTGIFYSTRADTAFFANSNSIALLTNGYFIVPSNATPWSSVGGVGTARIHNKWDAVHVNAFGTSATPPANGFTVAEETKLATAGQGRGATPYNAGSPVSGPQSGVQWDRYGTTGPWNRVQYPGSCFADDPAIAGADGVANGAGSVVPEAVAGVNSVSLCTDASAMGVAVGDTALLPANTNAVRIALGGIMQNEIHYAKIRLKVTSAASLGYANWEAHGGDSAQGAAAGNDNPWRYWVGAVGFADLTAAKLILSNVIKKVNGVAYGGGPIPANATIRYRLTYANGHVGDQTNVVLSDVLPTQTTGTANFTVISGPNILPASLSAGTLTFATIATLKPGQGGAVEFDVMTSAAVGATVTDTARIASTQLPTLLTKPVSVSVANFNPISAADDSVGGVNGTTGAPSVLNAYTGDTVNSVAAAAANGILSVAAGSSVPAGLSFDTATGDVSVDPGTAPGTYSFDYSLCEVINAANCDVATITVTVVGNPIVAADDSAGGVNGASGAANVLNAFTGDTLSGGAATAANTTLAVASGSSVPAGLTFNATTGDVSVAAGTAAGTYSFDYSLCELASPPNCDTATISVTVVAAPVVATDDSVGGVNGASGASNVLNAFAGDMLNGAAATTGNATIVVASGSSVPAGLTFNAATGDVSVSAATPAGPYSFDYTLCEILNPTNCDTATITVTVVAAPVAATDDSVGGINGASGASNVLNAFAGDTVNGAPATASNATVVVASGSSVPTGLTFNAATGNVSVTPGTPAGPYSFDYTLCEIINPTNCDTATITVTVIAAPVVASDDSASGINGASGAANVLNSFTADTVNGAPATAANATLAVASGSSVPSALTFNPATGDVSVLAGTPAGPYSFDYTLCEILNPTNCDTATDTVTVVAAPIVAAGDNVSGINGAGGASNVLNAFAGDTLNGAAATAANTTMVVAAGSSVPPGLTFNPATGDVSVLPGTPAGPYNFDYTLCETLNPANCDTATVTVTVVAVPIVATDDSVGGINGASGAANVLNAFTSDTLNGAAATPSTTTITLAVGSSVPTGLTFNAATGDVSVVPGTPAGPYNFDYTLCEILNPTNCDTATVTVTVIAAPVVAVDDSAAGINGKTGATNVLNAFTGDTLNGAAGTAANSTLAVASGSSVPAGLTFNSATGSVGVSAGTPAGPYNFDYTLCEILNPTNCDTATDTVTVIAAPIVANDDAPAAVTSGIGSANLGNAFANDTLNGAAVITAEISASVVTPAADAGVALDTATGVVSVATSVGAGDYTIVYKICEQLNPTNCATATITIHVGPPLSSISGTIYLDLDGDQALDANEPRRAGWIVEILFNGSPVGSATTDGQGNYQIDGLVSGSGYSIVLHNPDNNVVYVLVSNLTLPDNQTVADQNLAIDPSGVIYNSVTRDPVAGATATLLGSNGATLPVACFVSPTQQVQVTGPTGEYRFDIVPGASAECPVGEALYTIAVTPPAGYSAPSTVLAAQAGPFDPTGLPGPVMLGAAATAPAIGDPTVYYFAFRIGTGDPDVIFNHIPIDPFLTRTPLVVTKTSLKRTASVGDLVPYTVTVRNVESVQRSGVNVVDILPPGFKYVPGTGVVNGAAVEPSVAANGRELTWPGQVIPANGAVVYKLMLVVGAGVTGGDRINTGVARNALDNAEISNRGLAVVSIVASAVFDCSEIIGKVFDDRDGDGYQDEGEPGIAAARLATVNGLLVTTDEHGRYHITCVAVPDARIGSNFVLKLDPRSLPQGYQPTIDNPQSIRLTRGKMSELNFGVRKADVVEVALDATAFDGVRLRSAFAAELASLKGDKARRLVVRIEYRAAADEDAALTEGRVANLKGQIEAVFTSGWDGPPPVVETNVDRASGARGGE